MARTDCQHVGREIRVARQISGRSIQEVAGQVGISKSQLSRIERGELRAVAVDQLTRAGAAVGLDIRVRSYPGPDPTLDAGQLSVIGRLRQRVLASVPMRLEVTLAGPMEQRAWDVVLDGLIPAGEDRSGGAGGDTIRDTLSLPVDVDTRVVDVQAQLRRLHGKQLASGGVAILWVVADTARNRAALSAIGHLTLTDFPVTARRALACLKEGRHPGGSAIILI